MAASDLSRADGWARVGEPTLDDVAATLAPGHLVRIEMTVRCHDAEDLPIVDDGGAVYTDGERRVQVMHDGTLIIEGCYQGPWMTELIRRLHGCHEPQEEAAFAACLRRIDADERRPVMVELGSWWSYYTIWFGRRYPGSQLVLIEPDAPRLETGHVNMSLNGLEAVGILASVGEKSHPGLPFPCESDGLERVIPVIAVDDLVRDHDLQMIDVLLMDVQGAELDALAGSRETIRNRRVRFIVVSTHHRSIAGTSTMHQQCLSFLRGEGAHIICEHTVSESFSGDGLIVASCDPRDTDFTVDISRNRPWSALFPDPEVELESLFTRYGELGGALHLKEGELEQSRVQVAALHDRLAASEAQLGSARRRIESHVVAEVALRRLVSDTTISHDDLEARHESLAAHCAVIESSRSWRLTRVPRDIALRIRSLRNRLR